MNIRTGTGFSFAGSIWLVLAGLAFLHWTPHCETIIGTTFFAFFLNAGPAVYAWRFINAPYPVTTGRFALIFVILMSAGGLASAWLHREITGMDLTQRCIHGPLPPPPL